MSELREFGKFRLDTNKKLLWHQNQAINLPLKEIELLCLLTHNNEVVSKEEILNTIWQDSFVEESNLSSHIYRLRKMFAKYGESEEIIKTVPKRGYRFTAEIREFTENLPIKIEKNITPQKISEEIEIPVELVQKNLPPAPKQNRWWIFALFGVILMVGLAAFFINNRRQTEEIKSIAVLPLKSFDNKTLDENLNLRMMDSMITGLGKLESISVRPTSSTAKFLQSDETAIEIGKKLVVDAVLEGLIQRENNKLRVTMQLVSVKTTRQIWSEQFDGEADKLLDLQTNISAKLLNELGLRLTKEQETKFAQRPTTNSDAYEEYLKGRYFWQKRTEEGLKNAIVSFEKAINLDPNFALAYSGLADVYCVLPEYSDFAEKEAYQLARTNALKALEIDKSLAQAFTALAFVEFWGNKNFAESERNFRRAIAVNPNYPTTHQWFANVLLAQKKMDESIAEMKKAQDLDPLSLVINTELGIALYYSRQIDAAIEQFRRTIAIEPTFYRAKVWLGRALTVKGNYNETLDLYRNLPLEMREKGGVISEIGLTNALANQPNEAEKQIAELKKRPATEKNSFNLALIYVGKKETEKALEYLKKAAQERESDLAYLDVDPIFDVVRENQEFRQLAEKFK